MRKLTIHFNSGALLVLHDLKDIRYDMPGTCGNIFVIADEKTYRIRESAIDYMEERDSERILD